MKNLYYLIWIDAIKSRMKNAPGDDWKIYLFILITTVNALNLWIIAIWLKYFTGMSLGSRFAFFRGTILNEFMAFVVQFAAPFILLNYFLIFHKKRYIKLIAKYPGNDGKIAAVYIIISALIAFGSAILYTNLVE